jgi:Domain of unknown function (DUF6378)
VGGIGSGGETPNIRARVLQTAESLINGDRNAQYGDPNADFARTAAYWTVHVKSVFERQRLRGEEERIDPHDVAIMMIQLKCSRLAWSPDKEDHWVDIGGYAGCGADCALEE